MKIKKALITAAGDRERKIPLQTLVDRDGATRTVLAMLVNEVVTAGVEDICVVVPSGEHERYASAVPDHSSRVNFIQQQDAAGYAGAIWSARDHIGGDPFLHLVGDHVYISGRRRGWAARLVELAGVQECSVS